MHNGTAKGKHSKRGGWKGAKSSSGRNHQANKEWNERKRANRPEQFWDEYGWYRKWDLNVLAQRAGYVKNIVSSIS